MRGRRRGESVSLRVAQQATHGRAAALAAAVKQYHAGRRAGNKHRHDANVAVGWSVRACAHHT